MGCCIVTLSIVRCLLLWNPMTLEEAEEIVIAQTEDERFSFRYMENGVTMLNHYAPKALPGTIFLSKSRKMEVTAPMRRGTPW